MRYRFARSADLTTLHAWLEPEFGAKRRIYDALPKLWQRLGAEGRIRMVVVEDQEQPPGQAIQVVTAGGFASEDFVQEYLADPHPGLAAEVYQRVLAGQTPLLSQREIGTANSNQGLNLVMLHFALRNPDLQDEGVQQVMAATNAAFFFFHNGYWLKTAMQEVNRRDAAEYMQAGGFNLVREFGEDDTGTRQGRRSFLLCLGREQVQRSVVNPLSFLFYPMPPRIHFSAAEQRLLELALLNESDAEIAQDTGVSLDAVKKTWRRAYERAAKSAPHLFDMDGATDIRTSRGVEKRRHLLEYVRVHLEELREHKSS